MTGTVTFDDTPPDGTDPDPELVISRDPATGVARRSFRVADRDRVERTVDRARTAQPAWEALGFAGRARHLQAWRWELARGAEELAGLVHAENGKPFGDAVLEIVAAVELINWAATNAERVLARREVDSPPFAAHQRGHVLYRPYGVVGVIGPWNFPVSTPMGLLPFALAAGNAVVFKPSEATPGVGTWLSDAFARAVPDHAALQTVVGPGSTGEHLIGSGVDKIAFTGSAVTGRRILAACAPRLIPTLLELGGKDALIVAEDADVVAAADAAVWGAFQNAGQGCISLERAYVVEAVYEEFLVRVQDRATTLRAGAGADAPFGPITVPGQIDLIAAHLADAAARGATFAVGGPDSVRPPFVDPVVLTDLPDDARALTEETFGPSLPIVRVRDVDDAIRRANTSEYALGSAVFSRYRGQEIAGRLRVGMTSINSAIGFSVVPALPFGGWGSSGFGRKHGDEGLREFAQPHAVAEQVRDPLLAVATFDRSPAVTDQILQLMKLAVAQADAAERPTTGGTT